MHIQYTDTDVRCILLGYKLFAYKVLQRCIYIAEQAFPCVHECTVCVLVFCVYKWSYNSFSGHYKWFHYHVVWG